MRNAAQLTHDPLDARQFEIAVRRLANGHLTQLLHSGLSKQSVISVASVFGNLAQPLQTS